MSVVRALRLAETGSMEAAKALPRPLKSRARPPVSGMEPRTLNYIAAVVGGELCAAAGETLARRVCTDSRQVRAGDLFVPLKGERFDGHDFVGEVASRGAVAVMANRSNQKPVGCGKILVEDTRRSLGKLAGYYRTDFELPVIAVGGSNGKTSTKELLASVLGERFRTLSSEASFNNDIGVPLTLLNLNCSHEVAVLEVGTNHPGELAPLVRMIKPQYGIITNIGREHLEFFGDIAGVAEEEGWLAELLPCSGTLFINGDTEWAPAVQKRCRANIIRVGVGPGNNWRAHGMKVTKDGVDFQVTASRSNFNGNYHVGLLGRHQAVNALFAMAVAAELGLSPAQVRRGLEKCRPARMRLQFWDHNGVHVLDDSYNANADSMLAALQALRDFPCKGKRVAVLGDMAELGGHTAEAHGEIGRRSAECGVTHLLALGKWAQTTAHAARAAGLKDVREFNEVPAVLDGLKELLRPGDAVLVKASRAAGLDRVAAALGRPDESISAAHR